MSGEGRAASPARNGASVVPPPAGDEEARAMSQVSGRHLVAWWAIVWLAPRMAATCGAELEGPICSSCFFSFSHGPSALVYEYIKSYIKKDQGPTEEMPMLR